MTTTPRPFLARGQAAVSRAGVRFRRHDPRRAGAARGDRRARAISSRRSPGSARSMRITPIPTPAAIIWSRRRRRRSAAAPAFDLRRRHAQSERGGGAKSGAARRARRRRQMARAGRPADRGHSVGGRAQSVRPCGAAQCARSAPARRRDRGDRARTPDASRRPRCSCRSSTASCCARRRAAALPAAHPAQDKAEGRAGKRGLCLRRRDDVRCR